MALLLLGNLGAKFSETSFLHFKTYRVFYANLSLSSLDNNFVKKFNSNNFTLSSMFSFQSLCSRKRKAVHYTSFSTLPYIDSFPCESQLAYFF